MMRTTVFSVGSLYGIGAFWTNLSITAAFAHAGSDRSPSMVGASEALIRAAATEGRTKAGGAPGAVGCAETIVAKQTHGNATSAARAPLAISRKNNVSPGTGYPVRFFVCSVIMTEC